MGFEADQRTKKMAARWMRRAACPHALWKRNRNVKEWAITIQKEQGAEERGRERERERLARDGGRKNISIARWKKGEKIRRGANIKLKQSHREP